MKGDCTGDKPDDVSVDDVLAGIRRVVAEDDLRREAPATHSELLEELHAARRKNRAIESVLLTLISQEFNNDPRRMARAILDLRMEAKTCPNGSR